MGKDNYHRFVNIHDGDNEQPECENACLGV